MSDDGILNKKWAKRAVEQIEKAVEEVNRLHPNPLGGPMRIVWGYANREEEEFERTSPAVFQAQEGLLTWLNKDYSLEIRRNGDKSNPDYCTIMARLPQRDHLPHQPKNLFNILSSCDNGIALQVAPDVDDDGDDGEVALFALQAMFYPETITGRTLPDTIERLSVSLSCVAAQIDGTGDDLWQIYAP